MTGEFLRRFLNHGIAINPAYWKIRRINNVYTIGYKGAPERSKVCSIATRNLNAPKDVKGRYSDNILIKRALGRTLSIGLRDGLETLIVGYQVKARTAVRLFMRARN
jgi:hypothetical protein